MRKYIKKLKSIGNSNRGSRCKETIVEGLRRQRKEHTPREYRVDLPYFHGKDYVKAYLNWEMKVEQPFACHQVNKEGKVPLATLNFQGYATYWWTSLM